MNFSLTDAASDKLMDILKVSEGEKLRISIKGGGCAGFEYQYNVSNEVEDGDQIHEHNGASVLIDPVSAPYLENAVLDYVSELFDSRFVLKNPHAKTTCGCGQSFTA